MLDDLASQITAAGISVVPQPSAETSLVIVAADPKHRVLDAALAAGHPADVVGIHFIDAGDGKPGLAELVLPDVTAAGTADKARALAARLGLNAVVSRDRPGFLTATLAYAQFNDAVRMFQDGFASPVDIDTGMMLGCGYPRGPLQMLDAAGRSTSSPSWRQCTTRPATRLSPRCRCSPSTPPPGPGSAAERDHAVSMSWPSDVTPGSGLGTSHSARSQRPRFVRR